MGVMDLEYSSDAVIEGLLQSVDRPGDFCVQGRRYAPMPTLEVEGVGRLAFPVPEEQLQALIGTAERAPYGKGPETVVDTSVRNCWQIGAERIGLTGGAWPDMFAGILKDVASGLGCPGDRLEARLYKLLVYERGGFFFPHRDSEKAPGMIATLTISLPVAGEGGELIVRHRDREIAVDMNVAEPAELAFAAFYADCPHEILPVAAGHRLSLIFNLCLRAGDGDTPREPPDYGDQVAAIARRLGAWQRESGAEEKIVWLLDHDYSEFGLSLEMLKNGDIARTRVLGAAADVAECELHAAIVHIEQQGDAMYDGDYAPGLGWGLDEADLEMGEPFASWYWLDGWAARDGARPEFGKIALMPGELLPRGALDDVEPDDRWVHEATGNEGVTMEHAWRRAALVLWPRSRTLPILAGTGIGSAVAWLATQVERDANIAPLASQVIDLWPAGARGDDAENRSRMLGLLTAAGGKEGLSRFLLEVIAPGYTGAENEALPAAMEAAGPKVARRFLHALVDAKFRKRTERILALLRRLDDERVGSRSGMVREALGSVLRAVSGESRQPGRLSKGSLTDLFILAWRHDLIGEAEAAAGAIVSTPLADPCRTLPDALETMWDELPSAGAAAFATLWRCAAHALLERSATPPREPDHWRIPCPVECGCEICAGLRTFCADPAARVARFPLRTDLRAHLHGTIDVHKLEIDHVTERRGRPYTLVCTKNRSGHKRRVKEHATDIKRMCLLMVTAPDGAREIASLQGAVDASMRA